MSRTNEWKCQDCGKFIAYKNMDSGTPYGAIETYYGPEPLDQQFWCGKCAKKEYKQCLKDGINMHNYWEKPNFQLKAMKKLGIVEKDFKLVLI